MGFRDSLGFRFLNEFVLSLIFLKMYTVFACTYIYTTFVLGSLGTRIACCYEAPYGWMGTESGSSATNTLH